MSAELISIIIPTLNEVEHIAACVRSAGMAENKEIIVSDGGSLDGTQARAEAEGALVLHSAPGRAVQMNNGAGAATGGILLFLHADALLPEGYDIHVRRLLGRRDSVAGAFRLGIRHRGRCYRFLETMANIRSRWFQMPYGDQALFMTSNLFWSIGCFPDMRLMEDFELVRRMKKCGRVVTAPVAVAVSPRRWRKLGILKTTVINQIIIIAR